MVVKLHPRHSRRPAPVSLQVRTLDATGLSSARPDVFHRRPHSGHPHRSSAAGHADLVRASRPVFEVYDPATYERRLRELAARGLGWKDIQAQCKGPQELAHWVRFREELVRALLAPLVEAQPGKVALEVTGSQRLDPPSDLDVTVFAVDKGASPAAVIGDFYREFRARFGAEPGFLLDANVLDAMPMYARREKAWHPALDLIYGHPELQAEMEWIGLMTSFFKVMKHLEAPELQALGERLVTLPEHPTSELLSARRDLLWDLELAYDMWTDASEQLAARITVLTAESPGTPSERIEERARNELYAEALTVVQGLFAEQETQMARFHKGQSPEEAAAIGDEVLQLELHACLRQAWARFFAPEAYNSQGAYNAVVGEVQGVREKVGRRPAIIEDQLESMFEHLGEVAKELRRPGEKTSLVELARASSKYLGRFLDAALPLAAEDEGLGAQLRSLREVASRLAELRADPLFEASAQKRQEAQRLVAEGLKVTSVADYVASLIELSACVFHLARDSGSTAS